VHDHIVLMWNSTAGAQQSDDHSAEITCTQASHGITLKPVNLEARGGNATVVQQSEPGLFEIAIENSGDCDSRSALNVELRWPQSANVVAADGVNNFNWNPIRSDAGTLTGIKRIAPQGRVSIGWLRLNSETNSNVDALILER
jgi:hypothetical protein